MHEECFQARLAVLALGHAYARQVVQAQFGEDFARHAMLPLAAVDQDQVGGRGFAGGDLVQKLKSRAATKDDKKSGTRVTVWPDPKYFDTPVIPVAELLRLLRSKAVLLPGVRVSFTHAKNGETQSWLYEQGLRGYLSEQLSQTSGGSHLAPLTLIPLFEGEQYAGADADGRAGAPATAACRSARACGRNRRTGRGLRPGYARRTG